ncbi:MAG: hypothetical protein AB1750_05270 [Chloroflexota bacterium]
MPRAAEINRRSLVRNFAIALGLILIAFFAKMEAINLYLAVPVGVTVAVYAYRVQASIYKKWNDANYQSPFWVLSLIVGIFMDLYVWPIYFAIPLAAGFFSGYLIYSALNTLFIVP